MRKSIQKIQVAVPDVSALTQALAEPFKPTDVKFKPAVVSDNRALALAYVDARVIQDRLDEVLGVDGWQDNYKCLEDGSVVCRLQIRLGNEWVTKVDVGSPSDQGDAGDRRKAAFSDALKRAAVKFGIGRYLYRFPAQWVDYDEHRKQFAKSPKLPAFAIPKKAADAPAPAKAAAPAGKVGGLPRNGVELQRRLYDKDAALSKEGLCAEGALVKHIVDVGVKAGLDADLSTWSGPAIQLAAETTRAFEAELRAGQDQRRDVA